MKDRVIRITLAVLLAITAAMGLFHTNRERQLKNMMASRSFYALHGLSQNLGTIILEGECRGAVSEAMQGRLSSLTDSISTANLFTQNFKSISSNTYDLARALGTWTMTVNDTEVAGILWDGKISESELEFIGLLKADIDALLAPFYAEDGLNLRSGGIKWSELREPLGQFMQKWDTWNPAFGEHWRGLNLT